MVGYVPDQKDIIYITLDRQSGTEMAKRRPCLVLSKASINQKLRRAIVAPITSGIPKIQTHVTLPTDQFKISGYVVVDQIRSIDYIGRMAEKVDVLADDKIYARICKILNVLIDL